MEIVYELRHKSGGLQTDWVFVTGLEEDNTHFFLCLRDGGGIAIPKRAFQSEEQQGGFRQEIQAYAEP